MATGGAEIRYPQSNSADHRVIYSDLEKMAEFIVRLGTPAGEIVTRTVEAMAANEARARLEREGFKVFAVTPPKTEGVTSADQGWRRGRPVASQSQRFSALQSAARRPVARRNSDSAGHHDVAAASYLAAAARSLGRCRRSDSWRRCLVPGVCRTGCDISANLHGVDSGRRTIGRVGRSAVALRELHATFGRTAPQDPRARWPIRHFCCSPVWAW